MLVLNHIIKELENNKSVFESLFARLTKEEYLFRPAPEKWCLLEIACHLFDEEREDFRARVKQVLEDPEVPLIPIDPQGWVSSRKYLENDFETVIAEFLHERAGSIQWLRSLKDPKWEKVHQHPKLGPLSANSFLHNWLAHDYLHIRQISFTKYHYLKSISKEDLGYAGSW